MMRCRAPGLRALGLALLLAGGALLYAGTAGAVIRGSALAFPLPRLTDHGRPQFYLAQRAIDRSWGLSEDSTYSEVDVPEWRSEGLAAGLSALLPGAGQLYAREGNGVWFALAEVAGWTVNRIFLHKAQTERDRSARFAGDPADTASAWSFDRYIEATGKDASELEAVWAHDRQAFYEMIARDPAYVAGWNGQSEATRSEFFGIRDAARGYSDRASNAGTVLWLNHLFAAVDALRAARLHNVMLQSNLELKLQSSWYRGRPAVTALLSEEVLMRNWLAAAMLLVALSGGVPSAAGSVAPPPAGPDLAAGPGVELVAGAEACRGPVAGTLALARPLASFLVADAPLEDAAGPLALSFGRRGARTPRAPRAALPTGALGAERARILLRSLTLPGWGQATLGRRTSAVFFGLTETAIWGTFAAFRIQVAMREDAFLRTAGLQAGIDLGGRDEEWRRIVGDFASSDEYNQLVVARDAANLYLSDPNAIPDAQDYAAYYAYIAEHKLQGANTWAWSDGGRLRYLDQRRNAQRAARRANTVLAVAVVNRIVSAVHAARAVGRPAPAARAWEFEVVPVACKDATAFQFRVHTRF